MNQIMKLQINEVVTETRKNQISAGSTISALMMIQLSTSPDDDSLEQSHCRTALNPHS